jgi:hypothetical protein
VAGGAGSGGRLFIHVEAGVVDRLGAKRRRGKSYSDAVLRLVEMEGACAP